MFKCSQACGRGVTVIGGGDKTKNIVFRSKQNMDLGQCEVNSPHKQCKNVENERCVPAWVCAEVAKMTFFL